MAVITNSIRVRVIINKKLFKEVKITKTQRKDVVISKQLRNQVGA